MDCPHRVSLLTRNNSDKGIEAKKGCKHVFEFYFCKPFPPAEYAKKLYP